MAGNDACRTLIPKRALTLCTDLNNNNSFDSNMGAGLGPAFQNDMTFDFAASAFTSVNAPPMSATSTQTVSPKDVFNDPFGSAPPSTAFTNMTTPDMSPFLDDSYNTSPMFQGDGSFGNEKWYSLFPEETDMKAVSPDDILTRDVLGSIEKANYVTHMSPALERTISTASDVRSNARSSPSVGTGSPIVLDGSSRRKSSSVTNAGISKPRRRKAPLPPITVDPEDKVALKRARNTLAARDSRQRKFNHVQTLENTVANLEEQKAALQAEVEKWKSIAMAHGYSE
jgi:hypothetical protein